MRVHRMFAFAASAAFIVGACSSGGTPAPSSGASAGASSGASSAASPAPSVVASLEPTQGETLKVLAWPGYVEDGTTPGYDWVSDFETASGCTVSVQTFGTSDEAFTLYATNPEEYDIVSASGDASLRLVRAGYVQPVNVDLVPNYADIYPELKDKPYNTVDGVHYGIPHARGSNVLMWRTDLVTPAPTSWAEMFDPTKPFSGKVSVYDAPIYIADGAVVLMKTRPELNITNPYALDDTQFAAVVDYMKQQAPMVGERWVDYTAQMAAFQAGDSIIGSTWPYQWLNLLLTDPPTKVDAIKPVEGATGWSDTWMINSKTKNLACAYGMIDHLVSPAVNAQISEYFGEAPSNSKSCALTVNKDHCTQYHAEDPAYWKDVWYWQTPETKCVDGRTDVTCKGFDDWSKAWTEIKG